MGLPAASLTMPVMVMSVDEAAIGVGVGMGEGAAGTAAGVISACRKWK